LLNAALSLGLLIALGFVRTQLSRPVVTDGLIAAVGILLAAVLTWLAVRGRRSSELVAGAIALGMMLAGAGAAKARLDARALYSYRRLARAVVPYLKPGCILGSYRHFVQALPFYTGHRETLIAYRGELAPFSRAADARGSFIGTDRGLAQSWASQSCVVVVADFANLPHLERLLRPAPSVIACEGKKLALYNRPVHGTIHRYNCRAGHSGFSLGRGAE
jgi:hypothetical protein